MPASSAASSALATASLTQVRSALRGLSKASRWRFFVKNSETEISRWRAPISTAEMVAVGLAGFASGVSASAAFGSVPFGPAGALAAAASGFALDLALDLSSGLDLRASLDLTALDFCVRFAIDLIDTSSFCGKCD